MPGPYPTDSQRRTLWSAATGLAVVTLGAILVGLIWLSGKVLGYLQPVLVPLAVAGILAFLLDPIVAWLERKDLSRLKAILCVFVGFLIFLLILVLTVTPAILKDIGELFGTQPRQKVETAVTKASNSESLRPLVRWLLAPPEQEAPTALPDPDPAPDPAPDPDPAPAPAPHHLAPEGSGLLVPLDLPWEGSRIDRFIDARTPTLLEAGWDWLRFGAGKVFGFIGYGLGFLMVPVYLFFFLKEAAHIRANWHFYIPLRASKLKNEVVETLSEMNNYLVAFFRGQVLVSIIDGVLTGIALKMMGLPYATLIGLALAILGVMPFIGFLLTLIPAMLIAALHFGTWQHPLAVFAIFFIVQQIDGLFIQPKIIGDKVGLHPMTIIFSILFWSLLLGGFIGALLAIPLTASVKVLFTRYVWEARIKDTLPPRGEPPPEEDDPAPEEVPA